MTDLTIFPWLSRPEFTEACHHLEIAYCRATLGPLRRRWRLRTVTSLDVNSYSDSGYLTYIQIVRPLEIKLDEDGLAAQLERMGMPNVTDKPVEGGLSREMEMEEDADEAALRHGEESTDFGRVIYEIHLHPTYRVPCLWFTLEGLPVDEEPFDLETVFRRLVPSEYKAGLRSAGTIGGISMDYNPVTGLPSFFIHPCLLGDAMRSFADTCNKENYLMLWLGLVGGCVGLWVPKEMAPQNS